MAQPLSNRSNNKTMRHLLLIGTFALTILMAACSAHDDGADQNGMAQGEALSFAANVSSTTRTTGYINSITDLQTAGTFRVWAWMHDDRNILYPMTSDFNSSPLQNVEVTYNAGKNAWQTDQTYYWPRPRYTVDFYAIYPTSASTYFDTTTKTLDYTTTAVPNDVDLMYATYSGHRTSSDSKAGQAVPLQFRHVLTQISFKGLIGETFQEAGWQVDVSNITLHNIYVNGTFSFASGAFGNFGGNTNSTFTMTPDDDKDYIALTSTAKQLTSTVSIPMLMPQQHDAWQPATECITTTTGKTVTTGSYLAVTYHVYNPTTNTDLIGTATNFETAYVPILVNWVSNSHYTYTITFGVGYNAAGIPVNNPIAISASIYPWQEQDGSLEAE